MIVTYENIDKIDKKYYKSKEYLEALLESIYDINSELDKLNLSKLKVQLNWQDYHNEYSAERVDPCPDYYGWWYLTRISDERTVVGGVCKDLVDVDDIINTLYEFII